MKKIFLISLLLMILVSCSKSNTDEPTNNIPPQLAGKWQFVEGYGDAPELDANGNPIPNLITNGYIVEFKANGTFISNQESGYTGGVFSIINGEVGANMKLIYSNGNNQMIKYQGIVAPLTYNNIYLSIPQNIPFNFTSSYEATQRLQKVIDQQTISGKK